MFLVVQARNAHPFAARPLRRPWDLAGDDYGHGGTGQECLGCRPLVPVELAHLDEQRGRQQDRLALPEPGEAVAGGGVGRDVLGVHRVDPEPGAGGRGCGDVCAAAQVAADQLDEERRVRAPAHRPARGDPVRRQVVRGRQAVGDRGAAQLAVQPGVQVGRAEQEVQDALVEPEPGHGQPRLVVELHQAPAAQWGDRGERAPVRLGQRGQGEREGGVGPLRIAAGGGAACGRGGVQLVGGGEQNEVALEGGESEAGGQGRERGGGRGGCLRYVGGVGVRRGCGGLARRRLRGHRGGARHGSGIGVLPGCRAAVRRGSVTSGGRAALRRGSATPGSRAATLPRGSVTPPPPGATRPCRMRVHEGQHPPDLLRQRPGPTPATGCTRPARRHVVICPRRPHAASALRAFGARVLGLRGGGLRVPGGAA